MSLTPPRDLTVPLPGSQTAREVFSRALGRSLTEVRALSPRAAPAGPARDELERFAAVVRAAPAGPLAAAMRRPTVSVLWRCARYELARERAGELAQGLLAELVATLYLELAAASALDSPERVAVLPPRVVSLGTRAEFLIPRGAVAVFDNGALTLERGGERTRVDLAALARGEPAEPAHADIVRRPYRVLDREILLALADNSPLATYAAAAGDAGNEVDLAGHAEDDWLKAFRDALAIVSEALPEFRAEMDLYLQQIFPIGYHAETHRSASYKESLGTVYMSLHPGVMTLAEAMVHEFSHNKLHALLELDAVLLNDARARFVSPLRPDPRPIFGVLLAVHAFLPVARMYERMTEAKHPLARRPSFVERFAQIRQINRQGAATLLTNARPTPAGAALLEEIRHWIGHFG